MNTSASSGVYSDIYIQQIFIQREYHHFDNSKMKLSAQLISHCWDIGAIELVIPHIPKINVFGYDEHNDTIHPLHISEDSSKECINLLLISATDANGKHRGHYCLITDFSKLMYRQSTIIHMERSIIVTDVWIASQVKGYLTNIRNIASNILLLVLN